MCLQPEGYNTRGRQHLAAETAYGMIQRSCILNEADRLR